MASYNGFSEAARNRVGNWQNEQYRTGKHPRPDRCCACGVTQGRFVHHCEDYSEPYGPHIWQFPMCYRCHSILHRRFSKPETWNMYRTWLRETHACAKSLATWDTFMYRATVKQTSLPLRTCKCTLPARGKTVLDEIEAGLYLPPKKTKTKKPVPFYTSEF
jgi:hypothetical protein